MRRVLSLNVEKLGEDRESLLVVMRYLREIKRRREHPYYLFKPDRHPKRDQVGFFKSKSLIRLVYGGSQSGKSRTIAQEIAWWLCQEHPYQSTPAAPRIYVVSASYRTIQEGVWRHLADILPSWEIEKQGPAIPEWNFPQYVKMKNGAQVDFISGQGFEEARRKLQAAAIDLAVVDEEVEGVLFTELQRRRLARGGRVVVGATLIRSEPWCIALEERAESGDPECQLFRFSTYRALECGHVKAEIVKEIENTQTEEDVQVTLHGNSRKSEGLIYPEFGRDHIIPDFEVPKGWTRFCALDPGVNTFAVLWAAVAPDDSFVVYRELYEHSRDYKTVADLIFRSQNFEARLVPIQRQLDDGQVVTVKENRWFAVEGSERIETYFIDPAANSRAVSGQRGTRDLLADYGLYTSDAQNHVEAGIQRVKAAMLKGLSGSPQLRVFASCKNLIKELRAYRWLRDSQKPNVNARREAPLRQKDHAADCLRYLVLSGMYYVPKDSLEELFREQEDKLAEVKVTDGVESRRFRHLQRIYHRQKHYDEPPAHVGGLGTDY